MAKKNSHKDKPFSLNLDKAQRTFSAKHIMNSGYGTLATLAFGQLQAERINIFILIVGIIIYVVCLMATTHLRKGTDQ